VDPLASKYPELTPFQFAGNTPIWATDLDGLEPDYAPSAADDGIHYAPNQSEKDDPYSGDQAWVSNQGMWQRIEGTILQDVTITGEKPMDFTQKASLAVSEYGPKIGLQPDSYYYGQDEGWKHGKELLLKEAAVVAAVLSLGESVALTAAASEAGATLSFGTQAWMALDASLAANTIVEVATGTNMITDIVQGSGATESQAKTGQAFLSLFNGLKSGAYDGVYNGLFKEGGITPAQLANFIEIFTSGNTIISPNVTDLNPKKGE
jgi:hypothetical protein